MSKVVGSPQRSTSKNCANRCALEDTIDDLVAVLHSYSLIRPRIGENTFSIHSVIHTWGRERLNLDERIRGTLVAIGIMREFSAAGGIHREDRLSEEYLVEQRLVPHLEFVLDVSNEFFGLWSLKAGMMANISVDQDFRGEISSLVDNVLSHLIRDSWIMPPVPKSQGISPLTTIASEESMSFSIEARNSAWKSLVIAAGVFKRQGKFKSYFSTELRRLYLNMSNPNEKDQMHILYTLAGLSDSLRDIGELQAALTIAEWLSNTILERDFGERQALNLHIRIFLCKSELGILARAPLTLERDLLASIGNPASPHDATCVSDFAVALTHTYNFQAAIELHRRALEIRQATLPNGHVDILTSKNGLGTALLNLGGDQMQQEGLRLIREAFEGRKVIHGESHPQTARSHSNLAIAYCNVHQHVEAIRHFRLSLKYWEEGGEGNIAEMVYCRTSYATALLRMGKYLKALRVARLSALEQVQYSGWEHPWTLIAINSWAESLVKVRRLHAARNLYRFVLEIRRKIPREDKALKDAANGIWCVYQTLRDIGENDAIHEIQSAMLPIIFTSPSILQESSQSSLTDLCDLAIALTREEQYEPATRLHRLVLARRLEILPITHESTLISMNSLAVTLEKTGGSDNLSEALELETKALQGRKQVLAANDPAIARSLCNMGVIYAKLDKLARSSRLYRESLQVWANISSDPKHEAVTTRMNLAINLAKRKLWVKASLEMKICAFEFGRRLGIEHRLTLQAINSWATVLADLRRLLAARNLYRFVLEMRRRTPKGDSILIAAFEGFLRVQNLFEELGLNDRVAEMQETGECLHAAIRQRLR